MNLADLSDDALLAGLHVVIGDERGLLARTIAYLGEVEKRRLDLKAACSSMFDFCRRRLALSEGEAYRRINAARLARRFPSILGRIASGEIHLCALLVLRDHLGEDHEELLRAAAGKNKRQLEELVAMRSPKPTVPASIRKLPAVTATGIAAPPATAGSAADVQPTASTPPPVQPLLVAHVERPAASPPAKARVEPLGEARYRVQLTASAELRQKIERATELMRHRNPTGDLAVVLERALDLLIAGLEKERLGKTARPQTPRPTKTDHVTRAVRRAVFARDGEQCSFVSEGGERCPARSLLELDHVQPRALGGRSTVENLRVGCRGHNRIWAEEVFGREHVARQIHLRQRKRFPAGAEKLHPEPTTRPERCRDDGAEAFRAPSPHDGA